MRQSLAELLKDEKLRAAAESTNRTENGVPVWMDAIRDKVYDCEALDIHSGEAIPLKGYRYQLQEHGKWGFISPGFTCVTPAIYDGIVASRHLIAAWTYGETEDQMDLTLSLEVTDAAGKTDIRLKADEQEDLPYPVFQGVNEWLRPEISGSLAVKQLAEGRVAYLYKPDKNGTLGLLQIYEHGSRRSWHAYYKDGILAVTELGDILGEEIPADGCTLDACLLALNEKQS
jgi:hypothetical protein